MASQLRVGEARGSVLLATAWSLPLMLTLLCSAFGGGFFASPVLGTVFGPLIFWMLPRKFWLRFVGLKVVSTMLVLPLNGFNVITLLVALADLVFWIVPSILIFGFLYPRWSLAKANLFATLVLGTVAVVAGLLGTISLLFLMPHMVDSSVSVTLVHTGPAISVTPSPTEPTPELISQMVPSWTVDASSFLSAIITWLNSLSSSQIMVTALSITAVAEAFDIVALYMLLVVPYKILKSIERRVPVSQIRT